MKSYKNIQGDYYEKAHFNSSPAQEFFYNSREDYFIEFMNLKGSERILDIGCGSGTFTRLLAKKYPKCKITGIDISEQAVEFAKKTASKEGLKNTGFKAAAISKIPEKNNSFDAIIVSHLIEHVENPERALAEVKEKLKKSGRLFLTTPNYSSLWPIAELAFDRFMAEKDYSLQEQHVSRFTNSSIRKLAEKSGFKVLKQKTLYVFSLEAGLVSKGLGNAFFRIDKALDFLPFGMISYLECEK